MINFFRKTRKKLADDNKPLKYMRYAIGEIVLVMIGILLALQVNNWNENRKNINEGKKLIVSIYNDLENDSIKIDSILNTLLRQGNDGIEVLNLLEHMDNQTIIDQEFYTQVGWSITSSVFVERNETTWDGLKASGKQDIIRNNNLKTFLNDFYTSFDMIIANFNEIPKKSRMDLRELVSQCHNSEDIKKYSKSGFGLHINSTYHEHCILSIPKLQKYVSTICISAFVNVDVFENLKSKNKRTLSYIEEHLGDIIHP